MTKQAEREYALKVDSRHLFEKPYNDPRCFREYTFAVQLLLERVPGGAVLDMGCGPGWTTLLLARAGFEATGVDISERMIEIASERAQLENVHAEFHVGDMEELHLSRQDFQAAMFFDCLHHCPNYPSALAQAHQHLAPGGFVVLFETTWLHRFSPHARETTRRLGVTELGFTRRQLRHALQQAGFGEVCFYHDPGSIYRGVAGFLKANLRLWADFFCCYPRAKNIVVARKL
jgi:SAM-dependent methyltransferase